MSRQVPGGSAARTECAQKEGGDEAAKRSVSRQVPTGSTVRPLGRSIVVAFLLSQRVKLRQREVSVGFGCGALALVAFESLGRISQQLVRIG